MHTIKEAIKQLVPPIIVRFARIWQHKYGFFGNFASWEDAVQASSGYDSKVILEKVRDSILKVKRGEAVYERDSVLFDKVEYSWPLLASLLWIASLNQNKLNLIDFGGSLGSTYYQNKFFLEHLNEIQWNIVEQQIFVECGNKYFKNDHIKFYPDLDECVAENNSRAIILSSVIPYLEAPYELLNKIMNLRLDFIVIDITPLSDSDNDIITVHKVSPQIYKASIPTWLLSYNKFVAYMDREYELISEFESFKPVYFRGKVIKYMGFIYKSRTRKVNDTMPSM